MSDLEAQGLSQLDLVLQRLEDDACISDPSSPVARFSSAF